MAAGIVKSLGARSPENEAIHAEFLVRKAETGERRKALAEAMKRQERVTALVRNSIDSIEESKRLLEQAKTRLEQLIEEAIQS